MDWIYLLVLVGVGVDSVLAAESRYQMLEVGKSVISSEVMAQYQLKSVTQCAMKAAIEGLAVFSIHQLPLGIRCLLPSQQATTLTSLELTSDTNDAAWAILSKPTDDGGNTAGASPASVNTAGACTTPCDPHDSGTWGIIPGQAGCSTYNMCSPTGISSQPCPAGLVLGTAGACDFATNVADICQCN